LSDQYSVGGKRPLAIAEMNAEFPPFENGEHNSESVSIINPVITPLNWALSLHDLLKGTTAGLTIYCPQTADS